MVVFVCPHGALKSRVAAALFNAVAPPSWRAYSAGLTPQEQVSVHAAALLAGTGAESLLDVSPPRMLVEGSGADRLVAIDCQVPEACQIPEAEVWELGVAEPGPAMREELRRRVRRLVATVDGHA